MIETDNDDFETYEEELEREIRRLKRQLENQDKFITQLKKERHEALDKMHDLEMGICPKCKANQEQYDKMRAAFERRKQEQKAIAAFLTKHNWNIENERLTITKLIKLGKEAL